MRETGKEKTEVRKNRREICYVSIRQDITGFISGLRRVFGAIARAEVRLRFIVE